MNHVKRVGALFTAFCAMATAAFGGANVALAANTNSSVVPDQVQRGGVAVVKYDAETKSCTTPQGGADLAGAEFTITNNSDHAIVFADENGKKTTYMVGESWTIQTKKVTDASSPFYGKYVAATSAKSLPYGTYHIQETKASPGYGLATKENYLNHKYVPGYVTAKMREWVDKGYDFTISADGQYVTFDGEDTATKTSDTSGSSYTAGPGAYNPLVRGGIEVLKRDHDLERATPQGNASLEGGTFVIYNYNDYPVHVWDHFDQQSTPPTTPAGDHGEAQMTYHGVVAENYTVTLRSGETVSTQMDDQGWVQPGGIVAIIQTGDDGRAQTFMDALPVGWYTIVEREAPIGYVREERWQSYVQVTNDDWDALVVTDCDDPVLRGAAQIQKFDATLLEDGTYAFTAGEAQGDGALKDAHIEIYNNSNKDVWIREANFTDRARGVSYNTGDVSGISGRVAPGGKVAEIVTNDQGIATIKGLPYGSYYAIEKSPSYGYALNSDWRWDFVIEDTSLGKCDVDGQKVVVKADGPQAGAEPADEKGLPQHGKDTDKPVEIYKIDAETGESISLVDGLPFDMSFELINASQGGVVFEGKLYAPGTSLGVFDTDPDTGKISFDGESGVGHYGVLPAGTYTVKEARAPEGYIKSTQLFTITVVDNGTALQSEGFEFSDKVIREDIQFQKVDSKSNKPMSGIPFLLEKLDKDGNVMEQHILVTDEDGMVDTSGDMSGYQSWRARIKDGKPHYNLADQYYDTTTGEFTYVAPYADKEAVLAELNGDGTEEHPGLIKELEDLMSQLDDIMTKANVAGIKTLYDELAQIIRELNQIAVEKGDASPEYAAKVAEEADKIVEIHEAIAAAKAAVGDDYLQQIDSLEAAIIIKEGEIKDAQERLAVIDDELSGDTAIWETGYWFFGGEKGDGIEPNETDGALPYGDYRLTELRCEANKGYDLMEREIHIKRGNGLVENYGTIDNEPYDDCDPCNDTTIQGLDVDMHKDSTPAPNSVVKPNSTITYKLNYENTSAETVPYLLVRDEVPESTTFKSAANDGVYVKDGNYVEWVVKDVEPGAKGTVEFTVTVNKGARSIITNQARFGTYQVEVVPGGDNDTPIGSTNIVKHSTDGTKTGAYLSAVKRSEPAPGSTVKIGDQIKYYVDVTNIGDTDMEAVAVVDTIPVGTELATTVDENYYDVDVISDGGYRIGTDMVGWNIGTIKAGATKTVSFTVNVTEDVRYSVSNQATFGASRAKCTGLLDNTTNIVTHKVETLPELTITKSADRDRYTVNGEIITYTLHIENNGRGNAVNVPVWDAIPEGTQYVMGSISENVKADENHVYPFSTVEGEGAANASGDTAAKPYVNWTIPVIFNRGGSVDVSYQVRVRDDVAVGDIIQNRATVGGDGPLAEDATEPTVTTDVTVPAVSNLVEHEVLDSLDDVDVIKTADPEDGSSVAPGQEITYTVTATNNGEHSVYGFGIRDAIPEHTTYKDGSLVVTGADGKTSTEIKEAAMAEAEQADDDDCGTGVVSDDTSIVWVPEAQLTVSNMNDADAENIYKIVVPDEEHYHIHHWKTLKQTLTHLQPGEYIEFEVESDDGYNLYWRATYLEDGRILLWKRILVPNWMDSANYARVNGGYGNYDQRWDDVYAIFDELKPGETVTLTFTVIVDEDVADNTEIYNKATYGKNVWAAPCFDLEKESNTTTHVVGTPHLVAEKTVDKTDARRGDVLTYKVSVTNDGTARAKDIAIYDEFREASALNGMTYVVGSWNVTGGDGAVASEGMASNFDASTRFVAARCNTLNPGETLTMTFQCLIADAVDGDVLKNKATWEADHEGNPLYGDLANETNEVETLVGDPKLSIEKTADPADGTQLEVGDTITYSFKVTNDSAVYTNDAAVFDTIPTYTTLVEGSLTGGLQVVRGEDVPSLDEEGKPVVDEDGNAVMEPGPIVGVGLGGMHLESGESREFSFKVCVDPTLVEDVTISNTATAGFSDGMPTMPLQTASNTTVNDAVAPDTELRVVMSADPDGGTEVHVGDTITYTITVLNESTTPAKDVCVFDYIPDYTTFVNGSATGGLKYVENGLVGDKPAVIATGLTIGAHETKEFTFQVKVDETLEDLIASNRATVGEFRGDPTAPLDIDSNEVLSNIIAPKPAISITDSCDPASGTQVKAGDVITYTFKVTETEGIPAEGVAVFDYIPANTEFIEGTETGGLKTIKNSSGTVIAVYADGIALDGNGSAEFSYQVEVGHVTEDTEIANQPTAGFATEPKLPLQQVGATMTHNIIAEKPVLRLTKTATPEPGTAVTAGDVIDYSFTVSNDSEAIARGVAVFDRVPANTTYVAGSADGLKEIKDESGNVVALYADGITLAAHRGRSFAFSVTVNDGEDLIISNRATAGFAESPTTDLELDSNEVLHGSAAPDVSVTKAATPSASTVLEAGDVITYSITVKNASTGADRDVVVFDAIPEGTTYVNGSLQAKGATEAKFVNGGIAVRYDKVEGKATHNITFKVSVNDEFGGHIENVATYGHGTELPSAPLTDKTNATQNIAEAAQPVLRLTKTAEPKNGSAISADDEIVYTFTLTNEGEGWAHGAAVYDRIPENAKFVEGSANGLTLTEAGDALYADGLEIAPGESKSFSFKVVADGKTGSVISNRATAGFATAPTSDLELDSNEVVNTIASPDTTVTKRVLSDVTKIVDGDEIEYGITVRNAGDGADFNVNVQDILPAGVTYVEDSLKADGASSAEYADGIINVSYDRLAGGATKEITFKVTVNAEFDGTLTNIAKWGHDGKFDHETNATSSVVEAKQPRLRIVKDASPTGAVAKDEEITYTITVLNDGEGIARGVAVFDRIPEHTTYVDGSAEGLALTEAGDALYADGIVIEPHDFKTFTFKVTVNDSDGAVISNRATCGFAEKPTTDLELDSNEIENNSVNSDIRVTKSANIKGSGFVTAGDEIEYTIKVENASAGAAYNVGVFDEIPAGTTYVPRTMRAQGADQTSDANKAIAARYAKIAGNTTRIITFKVRVNDEFSGNISNIATWGEATARPIRPLSQESNAVNFIAKAAEPLLRISQTSTPENGSMISVGDEIEYNIVLSNDGNGVAHNAAVYNRIPAHAELVEGSYEGLTLSDDGKALYADGIELAPGSETSFTFKVRANKADASIINHASAGFATAPTHDLEIGSNEIAHTTLKSDVRVTKTSNVDSSKVLKVGDEITYTIKVENASAGAAYDFGVFDPIPEGTTYVAKSLVANGADQSSDANGAIAVRYAKLDGNSTHTITFKVKVVGDQGSVSNIATYGPASELPSNTLAEQTSTVINTVEVGGPELRLTKSADPGAGVALSVGDEITYTINLTNDSDVAGAGIAVFDRIPAHTSYVDGSANGLVLNESGDALYADGIELAAHETKTFTFKVKVEDEGVIISNRATAGIADAPTTDLELDSNEVVNAAEAPNTEIEMFSNPADGATVTEGSDITYTIRVRNTGRGNDRDVAVYAPIPEGTAYVDGSLVADGAESIAQTVDGTVTGVAVHYDTVKANSTSVITYTVRVLDTAGATVEADATMGHLGELPTTALEIVSNKVTHILDKAPVLSIVKTQEPGNGAWVAGGDELTYHITVTNEGNTIARKVGVYDEAPENTKFVKNSLTTDRGETYVGTDGLLTTIAGDLMPGESVTMTFKVKIDLGFVGTIYNRAMWVSPAADPENVVESDQQQGAADAPEASGEAAGGAAAPTSTVVPSRLIGVLGATVPIPDGSYSGVSNEVTAGGGETPTPDPTPEPTPAPTPTPDPDPDPEPTPTPTPGDSGSNETNAGVKAPEVKITKTATPVGTVKSGSEITYTIKLENTGDVNANSLYMKDIMPTGVTLKAGSVTVNGMTYEVVDGALVGRCSLKPGEVAVVTFKATVGNNFSGDIVNEAVWGQADEGETPEKMLGSSKVTTSVVTEEMGGDSNEVNAYVNKPTIQLIKTSDPEDGSIVEAGDEISYTLTATNIGRVNANGLYILDEIPEGITVDAESVKAEGLTATFADGKLVARGSLSPTASATVTFKATVDEGFVGDIINMAKWGQADEDKVPEKFDGESNEDMVHAGTTDVELIKTSDHADGTYVSRGAKLTYTITAENKGTLDVNMVVTDKVPEGTTFESFETVGNKGEIESSTDGTLTFKPGNLKPGEKAAFKFTVTVNSDAIGDIKNVATWTDGDKHEGTSNSVINHVSDPKISVTKTNSAQNGKAHAGDTIDYTITVTNSGTTKGLVRLTDSIPEGLTLNKDSVKVMTDSLMDELVFDDTTSSADGALTAASDELDADANATDEADGKTDVPEVTDGEQSGDVEDEIPVAITDNSPLGHLNKVFTDFVDWITGAESEDAGIVVDDASLKGAFYIQPGQTVAITYSATLAADAKIGTGITNTVNTEVEGGDPSHAESTVTIGEAKVSMVKAADVANGASVKVGDIITYTMFMKNSGNMASDILTMTDSVPDKTTYVEGSAKVLDADGKDLGIAEDKLISKKDGKVSLSYKVGSLAAGAKSNVLTFQVKVAEPGDIKDIENIGHWTAIKDPDDPKPTDPEPSNPVVTPVEPTKPETKGAKLEIKKEGIGSDGKTTDSFKSNSAQDWKITITNSGDETAKNVSVKDILGDGMTFVKAMSGGRTLSAEVTGSASTANAYAAKLKASAQALRNSDGSYSVGVSTFKDGYLYGSAADGVADSNYATAIPMGTYEVTVADGYRGAVQVIAMDDSGKVITSAGSQGTLGYTTSAKSLTVTIPDNGRLVIACQKNTNNTWTDANTSEHAFNFRPTGATKLPETSTGEYAATFVVDEIKAGESATIVVTTKTAASAPSKITNTAKAYLGANDKDGVSATATLSRSDYSEPKKPGSSTENLPQTAAAVAGLLVVAAGVGALGYGVYKLRRKDEDGDAAA